MDALRFAEAVAAPDTGALMIDADNSSDGYASIPGAVASGKAFAIIPRDGLAALDIDDPRAYSEWVPKALRKAHHIGATYVQTVSGTPGHSHAWINAPVGWTTEALRKALIDAGAPAESVRGGTLRMRPPLSPHRNSGRIAALVNPLDATAAYERLNRRPGLIPLDAKWLDVMRLGDQAGKYRTRTAMIQALATAHVNAGTSYEAFRGMLGDPLNVAGEKYRCMNRWTSERWLTRLWDAQCTHVRNRPARPVDRAILRDRAADTLVHLSEHDWSGQAGQTDKRVMRALLNFAVDCASQTVTIDQRRLAALANVDRKTLQASIKRLERNALVKRVPTDAYSRNPDSYRLTLKPYRVSPITFLTTYVWGTRDVNGGNSVDFGDVFSNGGLGANALAAYRILDRNAWQTTTEILDRAPRERSRRQLRRDLDTLHKYGYALRRGNRWLGLDSCELYDRDVAKDLGVLDRAAQRAEYEQRERETYYAKFDLNPVTGEPNGAPAKRTVGAR